MKRIAVIAAALVMIAAGAALAAVEEDAKALMIDVAGWVETDALVSYMGSGTTRQFFANRSYRRGTDSVEVALVVGVTGSSIGRLSRDRVSRTVGDTVITLEQIDGFDIVTTHKGQRNEGTVEVLLEEYHADAMPGGKIVFRYDGMTRDQAVAFAKRFDWGAARSIMERVAAEIASEE